MEMDELFVALLSTQRLTWYTNPSSGAIRAIETAVTDTEGLPVENWCLVTAACYSLKKIAIQPAAYKKAAKQLGLDETVAKAVSMHGDRPLQPSHPLYAGLAKLTTTLLAKGGTMQG